MKPLPEMKVGDKVRYIDERDRLFHFFSKDKTYTVETSDFLPDGKTKIFTFVEIPGYTWACREFFKDA